jgi:hypothetical protein
MVKIVTNKGLHAACPSILDIEPTIETISVDAPLEIGWSNSRQEQLALDRQAIRKFTLYVPDAQAAERAANSLEVPLTMDANLLGAARTALSNKKLYNWRDFAKEQGVTVTRNIVLKIAADELRSGNRPKLAYVAKDILLDGVTPSNADTLLRLRQLRGY